MTEPAWRGRVGAGLVAAVLAGSAFLFQETVPDRVRAIMGVVCFISLTVACSSNFGAINWRTVGWGLVLQITLAVFILKFAVAGIRPGYTVFSMLAAVVTQFLEFTSAGSSFVFGVLADQEVMGNVFPNGLVLAFGTLPVIIFVSSVFTVLYGVQKVGDARLGHAFQLQQLFLFEVIQVGDVPEHSPTYEHEDLFPPHAFDIHCANISKFLHPSLNY